MIKGEKEPAPMACRTKREQPDEQLLICGFGLRPRQLTLETLRALKECRTVFHDFLDAKAESYARKLFPGLKDLRKLRRSGDPEAMADAVLSAAAKGHTIAFLGYGNPITPHSTAEVLIRRCRKTGLPHRVINSLSVLDEILIAAGDPVLDFGLQLFPSDVLLARKVRLSPWTPTVTMLRSHLWALTGAGIAGLVKHLGTIYPPEHRLLLIPCPGMPGKPGLKLEIPLPRLAAALKKLPEKERSNAALFIPMCAPDVPGRSSRYCPKNWPWGG